MTTLSRRPKTGRYPSTSYFDENNSIRLELDEPGTLRLTTVDDGVERTETRWTQWTKGDRLFARPRDDGTIIASKATTDATWTLNLRALPDDLAQKIRELPALVWDERLLRKLPPLVPWTGDQYVTSNGVTYIRNNRTQELRAFSIGASPPHPNAAQMMAGDSNTTSTGGAGNGGPPEEEEALRRPDFVGWRGRRYIGAVSSDGSEGFPSLVREGESAKAVLNDAARIKLAANQWLRANLPAEDRTRLLELELMKHGMAGYLFDPNRYGTPPPRRPRGQEGQNVPRVFRDGSTLSEEERDRILRTQHEFRRAADLEPHGVSDLAADDQLVPYVTRAWDSYAIVDGITLVADAFRILRTNPEALGSGPNQPFRPGRADSSGMFRRGDHIYLAIPAAEGGRDTALLYFVLIEAIRSYGEEIANLVPPVEVVTLDDGEGGAVVRTLYSDEEQLTTPGQLSAEHNPRNLPLAQWSSLTGSAVMALIESSSATDWANAQVFDALGGRLTEHFSQGPDGRPRVAEIETRELFTYSDGTAASWPFPIRIVWQQAPLLALPPPAVSDAASGSAPLPEHPTAERVGDTMYRSYITAGDPDPENAAGVALTVLEATRAFRQAFGKDELGHYFVPQLEVSDRGPHELSWAARELGRVDSADSMSSSGELRVRAVAAVRARAEAAAREAFGADATGRFSWAGVDLRFVFDRDDVLFDRDLNPREYIPRIEPETPYPRFEFREEPNADHVDRMINWTETLQERLPESLRNRLTIMPVAPGRTPTEIRSRAIGSEYVRFRALEDDVARRNAHRLGPGVVQDVLRTLGADGSGVLSMDGGTQGTVSVEVLFTSSGFPAALRPIQVTPIDPDDPGPIAAE